MVNQKDSFYSIAMIRRLMSHGVILGICAIVMVTMLCGCSFSEEHIAEVIEINQGNSQTAHPGQICEKELVVQLQGPERRGLFGGAGKRYPAVGIKVQVTPVTENAEVVNGEGVTDAGGNFRCELKLAKTFGDQYFRVDCIDFPDVKPVYVHAISGITITGDSQEVIAGDETSKPIQINVTDDDGVPAADVPVFFTLKSGDSKAKISAYRVLTDRNGNASIGFRTADGYTGRYEILAEVGEKGHQTRGIVINVLAMSRLSLVIAILGGLGIFIFGMTMMSDGLQQLAGDRLKGLLQMFTSNRINAMLAGLVVTSIIQSSGACTVMVVGFVNAALLNINQAIGIILGSAIGTTVTAQMVSFKLDALALPAVAVGVLCMLMAKKSRSKGIAVTILGFGLLFYGMMLMSSELKALADFPSFVRFFKTFDCTPEIGSTAMPFTNTIIMICIGIVVTVLVQSSSATVGVAIALADSGLLDFYTAVPFVLGCNIGSNATGLIASIGTNRASQQTAVAATLFKILAVLIMLPLFYVPINGVPCFLALTDVITSGDVFASIPENIGRHVASMHTLFNICSVVVFLPFINMLAVMSRYIVPSRKEELVKKSIVHLEPHLLNTPSAALSQVFSALMTMTRVAMEQTRKSVVSVTDSEHETPNDEFNAVEDQIDDAQKAAMDYLVLLTRHHLNLTQSASIPIFMHCVNDIERIGDRALNIYDLLPILKHKDMSFSPQAIGEIKEISDLLNQMERMLMDGMSRNDMDTIQKIIEMNNEVKHMTARFERSHEARLQALDCTVEKGVVFVELLSNLERISAHLTNIAERAKDILPHSVSFA